MKKMLIALTLTVATSTAMAAGENNVGSCGWGSKLFDGQSGIAPQIFAATTNGFLGNQTFAITFGSSGCTQDGVVSTGWQTAMYIDGNKLALARDAAAGQGESLEALAVVMGVSAQDKPVFNATLKEQFAVVFASDDVAANLKKVLATNERLAPYAVSI